MSDLLTNPSKYAVHCKRIYPGTHEGNVRFPRGSFLPSQKCWSSQPKPQVYARHKHKYMKQNVPGKKNEKMEGPALNTIYYHWLAVWGKLAYESRRISTTERPLKPKPQTPLRIIGDDRNQSDEKLQIKSYFQGSRKVNPFQTSPSFFSSIWRFPEIGVPPNHPNFRLGFSIINRPFRGTPIFHWRWSKSIRWKTPNQIISKVQEKSIHFKPPHLFFLTYGGFLK